MNMKKSDFSMDDIKELINLVSQTGIDCVKIEQKNFKIEIQGKKAPNIVQTIATDSPSIQPVSVVESSQPETDSQPAETPSGNVVKSPIVGTYYESPAPDKPAFIQVGSKVNSGDTLFIIESMKLMNEVTSELSGTVKAIHVKDGEGVEYGQPILTIE